MSARFAVVVAAALSVLWIAACGSDGASKVVPARVLTAEVCTEGEARDTKLYIRNLDDFDWRDITFSLVKADETFAREWAKLPPESQGAADPFTDPSEFSYQGTIASVAVSRGTGVPAILRLHNFSGLESATIEIGAPQPGEWSGDVQACQ